MILRKDFYWISGVFEPVATLKKKKKNLYHLVNCQRVILDEQFSKYVAWNSSVSIIWELVRNENFWAPPQKLWGWGPEICISTSSARDSDAHPKLRIIVSDYDKSLTFVSCQIWQLLSLMPLKSRWFLLRRKYYLRRSMLLYLPYDMRSTFTFMLKKGTRRMS